MNTAPTPNIAQALALAQGHQQAGRLEQAEQVCLGILRRHPVQIQVLHLLAMVLYQAGKHAEAADFLRQAIDAAPTDARLHHGLAAVQATMGRFHEARRGYQRALAFDPDHSDAHRQLAAVLDRISRGDRNGGGDRAATTTHPGVEAELFKIGSRHHNRGNLPKAIEFYQRALNARSGHRVRMYNRLGVALQGAGRRDEAIAAYGKAIELNPSSADAHRNLGSVLKAMNQVPAAVDSYRRAAVCYRRRGHATQAEQCYDTALALKPDDPGLKIHATLATVPVIMESAQQIDQARTRLEQRLDALLQDPSLTIADPHREVGNINFNLAYHGLNDRQIQAKIAKLHAQAAPCLAYTAPHCVEPPAEAVRPIRIGFLSSLFYNHTVGKLTAGLIEQLDRTRFHVVVLTFPRRSDNWARSIQRAADERVLLPRKLEEARAMVADQQLDVLFYPDIGMDPITYFLAFARLAPVQCVTWGHPVTTGIPTVDFFLSNVDLDTEDAQSHYVERVIRHRHLPVYYHRPKLPPQQKERADLGVSKSANLYLCPQSLFKLHPDFDPLLRQILERDPAGQLVLIEWKYRDWTRLLRKRLTRSMPAVVDRIKWLRRLGTNDFLRLMGHADVMLDPICYGGGNTTLEAIAMGVPIVTWPGPFMRSRVTYACYRQMGLDDCVASSAQEYVDLAVRLGTDKQYRSQVATKILARNDVLYENHDAVGELEQFFVDAVSRSRVAGSETRP